MNIILSDEQNKFIEEALTGKNILVDACIGSGKTTAIQALCNEIKNKNILYLTFNKLLKEDAQNKIKKRRITVQNYAGFAFKILKNMKVNCTNTNSIDKFNAMKPIVPAYEVLILDEYQDINDKISKMLSIIKSQNPNIQIIAVGDMSQKIYDNTTLNVESFINSFLDNFIELTFTQCFRLNNEYAKMLGSTWGKPIIGVNDNCCVEIMKEKEVFELLKTLEPKQVLCLGAKKGKMTNMLNKLEREVPEKFNKYTTYATIDDRDSNGQIKTNDDIAIFTTYDRCKGMEKDTCIIFDFDENYWYARLQHPNQKYEILRNLFLVAASRGKNRIVFCSSNNKMLSFKTIGKEEKEKTEFDKKLFNISNMFDFKYTEDVDKTFNCLQIEEINDSSMNKDKIDIKSYDGLIDMSPCIGTFVEACYFSNYSIDDVIDFQWFLNSKSKSNYQVELLKRADLMDKVRYSTALNTKQMRYYTQAKKKFIEDKDRERIISRLSTILPKSCDTQKRCELYCKYLDSNKEERIIRISGLTDEIYDHKIYELKFVSELSPEHFLQLATYMVAVGLDEGRLWNLKNNTLYRVTIPDEKKFLDSMITTITKGYVKEFQFV